MTVGDIIYNDNFDFNANYAIYKCKPDMCWNETEPFFSTSKDGYDKPLNAILNMPIKYLTIHDNVLIIEVPDTTKKQRLERTKIHGHNKLRKTVYGYSHENLS